MRISYISLVLAMGVLAGCGESPSNNPPPAAQPATTAAQKPMPLPPLPTPPPPQTVAPNVPPAVPPGANAPETPPTGMIAEKAAVGSGDKGRDYGEGVIVTPVATYFAAREKIMFTIQIPKLLEAYKFEHDMKGPKSNKEFMEQVIKKYKVELPTLPPGHTYWYDAKDEELKVLRPK